MEYVFCGLKTSATYQYGSLSGFKNYKIFDSTANTQFNTNTTCYTSFFAKDYVIFTGSSSSSWLGSTPWNADTIIHKDTYILNGLGSVSSSIDSGGVVGLSISTTSDSVTYTYQLNDEWQLNANYDVKVKTTLWTNYDQEAVSTFQFGNSFYTYTTD